MQLVNEERRSYFQLPKEYKESVCTLAKLEYERDRTSEKFEYNNFKDDKYFKDMRSCMIFDKCNKIAANYNNDELARLNKDHQKMLTELHKLEGLGTGSVKYNRYEHKHSR